MKGIVTIVAGGWSARKIDLRKLPGTRIAVNEACVLIPCDVGVSMDRLWTERRWPHLAMRGRLAYIRNAALKNIKDRPRWLTPFECDYKSTTFATEPGFLNGTNSGFCALNLAYQLRPSTLFLIGFDMNLSPEGQSHWHPRHEWADVDERKKAGRLTEWSRQFDEAARAFASVGTLVHNVSLTSSITSFSKLAPERFREWHQTHAA